MQPALANPTPTPGTVTVRGLLRVPRRLERAVEILLLACAALSIFVTIGIVIVLAFEAVDFFTEVPVTKFLGELVWTPHTAHFGIWALVAGTALTSAIAIGVALPFGLMAAIYLSEYASPRARRTLKPALELLAGVPTIVYGFFALTVITPWLRGLFPQIAGFNALGPGLVMGIMIIPMISSLAEDAIFAVPNHLREASYGLGASKLPTITRVVVPTAWSGIAAATTLAISRAVGETMIVAVAAGQSAKATLDPRGPVETMAAYIVRISTGDVPTGSVEYKTLFVVGACLFLFTLVMNLTSYRLSRKRRTQGGL